MPFTLVGTALLAGLARLCQVPPSRRLGDYGGLILAALPVGAVLPLPLYGAAGLFFGSLLAALTASLWAALHGRACLSTDHREAANG